MTDNSATPSQGDGGSDLRSVANQINGLLDDQGHYNPNPDQLSRGHPDYDPADDPRESGEGRRPDRDKKGRFRESASEDSENPENNNALADADDELSNAEFDDGTGEDDDVLDDADTSERDDVESVGDDAPEDDADTDPIQTLSELAEALELQPEEFKESLTHTFKAAGEEVTVTLAELEKGYQKDADYRRSTQKLVDDRAAMEGELQTRAQGWEQQQHVVAQHLTATQALIEGQINSPQMQSLRELDQAEWTARSQELRTQLDYLNQVRQQAAANYEQTQATNLRAFREREQAALTAAVPDFGTEQVSAVKNVMTSLGYTNAEIMNVMDSKQIIGALELHTLREENARLQEQISSATNAVKKVKRNVPKLTKPGKARAAKGERVDRNKAARLARNLKKSKSVDDAAAVIENMMR